MTESKILRWVTVAARWLLGLAFFAGGISYFLMSEMPVDPSTPSGKFLAALIATGYFLPMLKTVEIIGGLSLFFKRWTPLGLLLLAPVIVNITMYALFLDRAALVAGLVLGAIEIFVAWRMWDRFATLFKD